MLSRLPRRRFERRNSSQKTFRAESLQRCRRSQPLRLVFRASAELGRNRLRGRIRAQSQTLGLAKEYRGCSPVVRVEVDLLHRGRGLSRLRLRHLHDRQRPQKQRVGRKHHQRSEE